MKKIYNNRGHIIALNNLDINVVNEITGLKYNGTIFLFQIKVIHNCRTFSFRKKTLKVTRGDQLNRISEERITQSKYYR